jgi:hypothetical protein
MPSAVLALPLFRHALMGAAGLLLAVAGVSAQPAQPAGGPPTSPLSPHPQVWSTTPREPAVVQGGTWGPGYVVEPPAYGGFSVYVPAWGGRPPHPGHPTPLPAARAPAGLPSRSPGAAR